MKISRISIAIAGSGLVQLPFKRHQPDDPCGIIAMAGRVWVRARACNQKALKGCKPIVSKPLLLEYRQYSPLRFSDSINSACVTSFLSKRSRVDFTWRERLLTPSMCTMAAQRLRRCARSYSSAIIAHTLARALSRRLASNKRPNEPTSTGKRAACSTSPIPQAFKHGTGQSSARCKGVHIVRALLTLPLTFLTSWRDSSGVHVQEGLLSNIFAGVGRLSKSRRLNLPLDSVETSRSGRRGY